MKIFKTHCLENLIEKKIKSVSVLSQQCILSAFTPHQESNIRKKPNFKTIKIRLEHCLDEIKKCTDSIYVVNKIWTSIDLKTITKLYTSVPPILRAVIKCEGNKTKNF